MIVDKREIALVDRNDRVIGYRNNIQGHENPVPLHRAVSVLIFNDDKILIQKRAEKKFTWPLFWTNTACSNVYKGETYDTAVKRALMAEMGIVTKLKKICQFIYDAKYNEKFGEHELDVLYVGEYSGEIAPNPKEVADYKWIKTKDLLGDVKKNPEKYTPWFGIILERLNLVN